MVQFKSTTTPKSERLLAHTLGYPATWHVVRTSPHPILNKPNTFQDIIYTGDPQIADVYFNHTAAMGAAMMWKEYGGDNGTPFYDDGGQMLPLEVMDLEEGSEVEVYYDQDRKWYQAEITEVTHYKDDERFVVKYKLDDAIQTNVCYERIRPIKSTKKKKPSKKRKSGINEELQDTAITSFLSKKKKTKSTNSIDSSNVVQYPHDTTELQLAAKMGLPEGWAVNIKPNSRFTFRSPDNKLKFRSKKAVFHHLGLPPPKHGLNPLLTGGSYDEEEEEDNVEENDTVETKVKQNKKKKSKKKDHEEEGEDPIAIEDGDPPWRTSSHKYLGRRVKYVFPDGLVGYGTCTGWISDKDVDKENNPGFVSERTNKPACLFHVTMDSDCPVSAQDFEDFEMEDILLDIEE